PVLPRQGRRRRVQGLRWSAASAQREGQDPFCPRHRLLPPPPASAGNCREARPRAGPASVRRRPLMAQAILLKDVDALGERGDVVDVAPGYLRNFLVPRKLAQPATTASIAEAQRRREAAERTLREA